MNQNTRSKIIEHSYQEFITKGYKQTTTKTIAELAQVNESTIFYIFKSKENLFHESISYYTDKIMKIDNEGLSYGLDLEHDFYILINKYLELFKKIVPSFRLLVKGSLIDQTFLAEIKKKQLNLQNHFKQYLTGMQKRGLIKEADYGSLVDYVFGLIFHYSITINGMDNENEENNQSLEDFCKKTAGYIYHLLKI